MSYILIHDICSFRDSEKTAYSHLSLINYIRLKLGID